MPLPPLISSFSPVRSPCRGGPRRRPYRVVGVAAVHEQLRGLHERGSPAEIRGAHLLPLRDHDRPVCPREGLVRIEDDLEARQKPGDLLACRRVVADNPGAQGADGAGLCPRDERHLTRPDDPDAKLFSQNLASKTRVSDHPWYATRNSILFNRIAYKKKRDDGDATCEHPWQSYRRSSPNAMVARTKVFAVPLSLPGSAAAAIPPRFEALLVR